MTMTREALHAHENKMLYLINHSGEKGAEHTIDVSPREG
jgi:hypothetical protein